MFVSLRRKEYATTPAIRHVALQVLTEPDLFTTSTISDMRTEILGSRVARIGAIKWFLISMC